MIMHNNEENVFDEAANKQPPQNGDSFLDRISSPEKVQENIQTGADPIDHEPEILLEPPPVLPLIKPHEVTVLLPDATGNTKIDQRQIPTALAFLIFGTIVGSMFPISHEKDRAAVPPANQAEKTISLTAQQTLKSETHATPLHKDTFENLQIEAKAAYVWDINTREALFKKNADEQLPLASLAKIMTAITVADQVPKGTVVTIDRGALTTEGDTGLLSGEQWRLRDLLEFTLLVSSNDGAEALAAVANARTSQSSSSSPSFITSMNKKAQDIGLTQSYFSNPSGLDTDAHHSGAYGSARDMARLFEYGLKNIPAALEATTYSDMKITSLSGFIHDAKNTNVLIDKIPSLIASKTGFTNLAGGNLVIAFEAGPAKQIVVAVLGSTYEGRFNDVEKLVWATLAHLEHLEN